MRRVFGIAVLLVALLPRIAAAAGGEGGLINLDKSLIIQAIKKSLDEAQAARAEAQAQRAEHAARVQAAHAEAQAIRATALHEAAEEQRRLVEAARAEAARLVEGARAETEQDIRRARQELRQEVGDLAVAVAERLIKRTLRDEDHRKIIEEALAKMERVG